MLRRGLVRLQPAAMARAGRTALLCTRARATVTAARSVRAVAAAAAVSTRALHAAAAAASAASSAPLASVACTARASTPMSAAPHSMSVLLFGRTYSRAGVRAFCTSGHQRAGGHQHQHGAGAGAGAGASGRSSNSSRVLRMAGAGLASATALLALALRDNQSPARAEAGSVASAALGTAITLLPDKVYESESVTADRLTATYGYVGGALALTSLAAWASYASGLAAYMLTMNPWALLGATLVSTISLLFGTRYVSYRTSPTWKHALWVGFNLAMGASLGVVGFYSSALVLRAAVGTAAVVGTLSVVGALSPTGSWRWLHAPLTVGLGVLLGAGVGQALWPDNSTLHNFVLYGSLALYGAFVVSDTNRLMERARLDPLDLVGEYDPINESLQLYINSVNTFLSLLQLLDELDNPRHKRRSSGPTLEPA